MQIKNIPAEIKKIEIETNVLNMESNRVFPYDSYHGGYFIRNVVEAECSIGIENGYRLPVSAEFFMSLSNNIGQKIKITIEKI